MKLTFSNIAGALALTVVAGLAGAGSVRAETGIVVYNAQHESLGKAWAEAFTKQTGIEVTLRNGSDMEFANQIVQEGAASPADVFLTENSPAMALVDANGLFAPLGEDVLAEVPAEFRPADGHWIGIAARSTVFAYNTTKLSADALPASIMDLADPAWKGRWGASPTGADFQAIVAAMLQLEGPDKTEAWLRAMKENAVPYRGNSAAMKAANVGQVDGSVIYHYYYFSDQARTGENSDNVALHYFKHQDPGAFVSISGGGVLASSKNKTAAEAFVKWIVGEGGQSILRDGTSFEYAVGKDAESNPKLVPLAELEAPAVTPDKLDNRKVTDMMLDVGLL
jgi:iron(III) transport system substrate-binding protein